jgi:hypothetical protein
MHGGSCSVASPDSFPNNCSNGDSDPSSSAPLSDVNASAIEFSSAKSAKYGIAIGKTDGHSISDKFVKSKRSSDSFTSASSISPTFIASTNRCTVTFTDAVSD